YKVSGGDSAEHEGDRRHERAELEVRHPEDAVAAGAAVAEPRAKADEQPAGEHPRQLPRRAESNSLVKHPKLPRRRPSAADDRGQKSSGQQADDERQTPRAARHDRLALKVRQRQREAADVLEARRESKPAVGEKQQRERDDR